ncbi:MAG: pyruvate kinase [Clostridiaceae bacterium]|nr:pyruvate kinase [Clostridiaceae bacterium]
MKIICTMGPKVTSINDIEKFIQAGMTDARFNFSHADYKRFDYLIRLLKDNYKNIRVIQDLQGNKLRVSKKYISERKIYNGQKILFCMENYYENIIARNKGIVIPFVYSGKFSDFKDVSTILTKDGTMKFKVIKQFRNSLLCKTEIGGIIRAEKGINAPGIKRNNLRLTDKDKEDIIWGLKHNVDVVCLSFVTCSEDLQEIKEYIKEKKKELNVKNNIKIWAKVECMEAIENFEDILKASDGIMLGRGDLKGECNTYMLPIIQSAVIKRMKKSKKEFIIGTYILESMKRRLIPSISELNDIYNFVNNKVHGLMLSTEITASNEPEKLIKFLFNAIKKYESPID